jgi:hypothetical protein
MPVAYVQDPDCKYYKHQMSFLLKDCDEVLRCACNLNTWATPRYRALIETGLKIYPDLLQKLPTAVQNKLPAELRDGTRLICVGKEHAPKWALEVNPKYPDIQEGDKAPTKSVKKAPSKKSIKKPFECVAPVAPVCEHVELSNKRSKRGRGLEVEFESESGVKLSKQARMMLYGASCDMLIRKTTKAAKGALYA